MRSLRSRLNINPFIPSRIHHLAHSLDTYKKRRRGQSVIPHDSSQCRTSTRVVTTLYRCRCFTSLSRVHHWRLLCMQRPSQWLLARRCLSIEVASSLVCVVWWRADVSVWFRLWWRSWRCSSGDEHRPGVRLSPRPRYRLPFRQLRLVGTNSSSTRDETWRRTFIDTWVSC